MAPLNVSTPFTKPKLSSFAPRPTPTIHTLKFVRNKYYDEENSLTDDRERKTEHEVRTALHSDRPRIVPAKTRPFTLCPLFSVLPSTSSSPFPSTSSPKRSRAVPTTSRGRLQRPGHDKHIGEEREGKKTLQVGRPHLFPHTPHRLLFRDQRREEVEKRKRPCSEI